MEVPTRILTMKKNIEFDFIDVDKISPNPLNPRRVFREEDINKLCDSIIEMGGIIVPLVVYHIGPGKYVLLDGERRLKAAKKLGMKQVPVNIIPSELPSDVNLSTMFNIHMARVKWNAAARALALGELKKLYKHITAERLSQVTGMAKQDVKDAERILKCPPDLVERCLHQGKSDYLRPANLVEMQKALEKIEEYLPDFFKQYDREKVARTYIQKRDNQVIPRNTDFRMIGDIVENLPQETAQKLIAKTVEEEGTGISDVYAYVQKQIVSKRLDLFKRSCNQFISVLNDFDPKHLDERSRNAFYAFLKEIQDLVSGKLRSSG